jgi:hypothetical protein
MNYLKLSQEFASYECNLLTTEQELQEQINSSRTTLSHWPITY